MSLLNVQMTGVKECLAALKSLPEAVKRKHMRVAMNAGGGIVKQTTVSLTPSRRLKRHQIVKVKQKRDGNWYAAVGVKRGKGLTDKNRGKIIRKRSASEIRTQVKKFDASRIAHLLEGGSRSHEVQTKSAGALATPIGGKWNVFGKKVVVSAKGQHFMQRAAAISGPAAVQKAITKLREAILSHANK